ncbi:hypothetical protein [Roseovarius sp.]|uniref:hypothetical protein n=1 Tax=Roseovarius sp. TaxID=1486281 RepID=UPI00356AFCD3
MKDLTRSIIGLMLAAAGVLACNASAVAEAPSLRVGVFEADVTLPLGHPCYPSYEPLETTEFPLQAKGVVIGQGDDRYVICAVDWCEICNSAHTIVREKIAEAVGTTADQVAVQCVHQHTAPMAVLDAQRILDQVDGAPLAFKEDVMMDLFDKIASAAGDAARRLEPCDRIGTSEAEVERVASNRRIPNGDGTVTTRYSSCTDAELVAAPEGIIDPMVKTITFGHRDKPIVQLHYYATHPQSFYGDPRQGWDFVGIARERLEDEEGIPQIYFTGCAGDVACGKYNDRGREARDGLTERLFAGLKASAAATAYQPVGELTWRTHGLTAPSRGFDVEKLKKQIADSDQPKRNRISAAQDLAFVKRLEKPFELSSLQIGDVFMVHLPGEPCIEYQLYAQRLRPEAFVAVAGYADGGCGYICLEQMFAEGGYEPTASRFAPEVEQPARAAVRALVGK